MKISIHDWIAKRVKHDEIARYIKDGRDFIPDDTIIGLINNTAEPDEKRLRDILDKSLAVETLTPEETAELLSVRDEKLRALMEEAALKVKKKVYDNRIVTFAPLYTGNLCVNNCLYCGFRKDNTSATRRLLTMEELANETKELAGKIGHKRLIVVYGEHPESDIDYMCDSIKQIYAIKEKTKYGYGSIRRVNVNAAPLPVESLKKLQEVGIGTYQVFQETYHHETYHVLHPAGTIKSDYAWRLYAMHRAFEAGIDDVGLGALFGLYDWRFEVLGLVYHSRELENVFGIGPHTISFPRLEPALNAPATENSKYAVSDDDFKKIITVIRLAVPHTGMIITARETPQMRRDAIALGITQTDASTKIGIGAYSDKSKQQETERQQFMLGDTRSLDEVVREYAEMGYISSFCTAGYRCGRTGKCIMDLLRTGQEGKFCKLNAILTFREWLDDFASDETRAVGEKVIADELKEVQQQSPKAYEELVKQYERTKQGERDLYF